MDSKQLTDLVKVVKFTQLSNSCNLSGDIIKFVEKKEKIKVLSEIDLLDVIDKLKRFDINLLWERKFWKLKPTDSICAVSSEIYETLKRIRNS